MEKLIDLRSHRVPLYWQGNLHPGVEVFAIATSLVSACIAVELLLDEMDQRCLWYGKEVIAEDGVFKLVLVEGASFWSGWQRAKRLELASAYRS
jgi:hypothetical protein